MNKFKIGVVDFQLLGIVEIQIFSEKSEKFKLSQKKKKKSTVC